MILASYAAGERAIAFQVFDWETSTQRVLHKWARRLLEWVALLAAFVLTGLAAQLLILREQAGPLGQRLSRVELPWFFYADWLVLAVTLALFIKHLAAARKRRSSASTP